MEYVEGSNIKKTSETAKQEIVHYFWKKLHDQELEQMRRNKETKSIYKPMSQEKQKKPVEAKQPKVGKDLSQFLPHFQKWIVGVSIT